MRPGEARRSGTRSRLLRGAGLFVVVAFFVFGWSDRSTVEVIELGAPRRVIVVSDAGPVVVRTSDSNRVTHSDSWVVRGPTVDLGSDQDESVVRIRCVTRFPCRSATTVDLVPGVELVVISLRDAVDVASFDGALTVFSEGGDVVLGPLRGSARVVSAAGRIDGFGLRATELTVEVDRAAIDLQFDSAPTSVVLTSVAGPIRLETPDTGYDVMVRTGPANANRVDVEVANVPGAASTVSIRSDGPVSILPFEPPSTADG
jgi:hypothetical protein